MQKLDEIRVVFLLSSLLGGSTALAVGSPIPIRHVTGDGVVAQQVGLPWYIKPSYPDYAVSGMPDFDQKQFSLTWDGPVAAANLLWWVDSEYESILNQNTVPPPANSDSFGLLTAYGSWDDHDPRNVEPFVNDLAFLMDTDNMRAAAPDPDLRWMTAHSGTFFKDLQVGISQYLQHKKISPNQTISPMGDCDGDGDVDWDDLDIIIKAFNTFPGSSSGRWNMAADLNIDNIVNMRDMSLVVNDYGKVGMFSVLTDEFPAFQWIADKVHACDGVVLVLEFWQDLGGGNWTRWTAEPGGQGGHYVTVAGVNSTTSQLLVSDPWQDAFEAGEVPGESPVPHLYPHGSDVHNDTQYVSHDAYTAAPGTIPSPYPEKLVWELTGYLQTMGFDPSWHAFVRAAVVTSPITIAVVNTETSKSNVGQGFTVSINATVENRDTTAQTFDVTAYVNSTAVGTATVTNLPPGANVTVVVAALNTTGWTYGAYLISAGTNTSYQALTRRIKVVVPGDINGDGAVDIYDALLLAGSYNAREGDLSWNSNADINCDNVVDIYDAILLANNYGRSVALPWP